MTDANYTAMLIVLDRSGSMSMIRDDMIGGIEQLIAAQAGEPGMLTIDVVTFDTEIELTHHFADPKSIKVELVPRGATALYDAVGWSFNGFGNALAELPEHARPGTVLVTIVTDGEENSSREYTADMVTKMIEHQREAFDWDVSFLGANQDAVEQARKIGIQADDAIDYDLGAVGAAMSAHAGKLSRRRQGDRTGYTAEERGLARGDNSSS
ncbi:vWA domain-containing protein [Microbacterium sp.]|uniref:vWA domain-containing protein n=1 Tax=Microbacterium sp. TaxID=51671 RepID=UPI0025FEE0F0|nr:vWA domain-containing protein [Microbacterium sp.]